MKNLFLLLLFSTTTFFYAQNTYTVDNKPGAPADYSDLQTAIDAVPTGSTLLVQGSPDIYSGPHANGAIWVNKQLTIIGPGYFLEQNTDTQAYKETAKLAYFYFLQGAEGSIISGFMNRSWYIYVNDCDDITIKNCNFNSTGSVRVNNSSEIMIINCYFNRSVPIYFYNTISNIVLYGNYINGYLSFDSANPIAVSLINNTLDAQFNQPLQYQAQIAYNNIFISPDVINSAYSYNNSNVHHNIFTSGDTDNNLLRGNVYGIIPATLFIPDTDPRYTDDGQFILSNTSPAIQAGENSRDCGMFGGFYSLSGIPNIPNIYEFTMPDTGYTNDGGIPITIKVKANH